MLLMVHLIDRDCGHKRAEVQADGTAPGTERMPPGTERTAPGDGQDAAEDGTAPGTERTARGSPPVLQPDERLVRFAETPDNNRKNMQRYLRMLFEERIERPGR